MKTIKHYCLTSLFLAISLISLGQSISPAPGNATICPGTISVTYTVNPNPNFSGCGSFTWTLSNGTFVSGQTVTTKTTTGFDVDVFWNDVAGTGTLTVTSSCNEGALSVSKTYAIKSLAGRTPANARAYQTLFYCGTSTISLAVDVMFLLNTGGTTGITQQRADGYEWTLPTGWNFSGGSSSEFINIYPDNGCRGGTVTVKAYMDCTSGKKYSSSASINIDRPTPSISITPQAGYGGPSCGSGQAVTFTVNHTISCVASNNGYLWNFPSGWLQSPIYTNSNSITVTPSGSKNDQGPVNVTVNLSCGTALPATPYQLVFNAPTISAASLVCSAGSSVSLSNVTPSIYVTWSGGSNMTVDSGQGTSTAVIKANSTGSLGYGTISATVNCVNTTVTPKTVWVGRPGQPGPVSGNTTPSVGGIYQYISSSPSQGAAYHNWILPYNGDPVWSQSGGNINGIIDTLTPNLIVGSSSGFLQAYGVNDCGNSGVRKLSVTPSGGGGGGIQRIIAYPNPAQKELTIMDVIVTNSIATSENLMTSSEKIPITEFTVKLFNDQNQEVKLGKSKKGNLTFDVQDLQNGFYYLHIQQGEELIIKQIQIKK